MRYGCIIVCKLGTGDEGNDDCDTAADGKDEEGNYIVFSPVG